jgi:PleD family two-component response regulator
VESAFERADAALYRAKGGGRNICVAAQMPSTANPHS